MSKGSNNCRRADEPFDSIRAKLTAIARDVSRNRAARIRLMRSADPDFAAWPTEYQDLYIRNLFKELHHVQAQTQAGTLGARDRFQN
jgi:hypothetical protein